MDFESLVGARRSTRGYLQKPVSKELMVEVVDLAKRAPSSMNTQGIMQSSVVREHGNIPDDEVIMTCVAMGWPDPDFVANDVVSRRVPNHDAASYVGFEDEPPLRRSGMLSGARTPGPMRRVRSHRGPGGQSTTH